jgi:hypothetical protein
VLVLFQLWDSEQSGGPELALFQLWDSSEYIFREIALVQESATMTARYLDHLIWYHKQIQSDIIHATLTARLLHGTTTGAFVENQDEQMEEDTGYIVKQLQTLSLTMDARVDALKCKRDQALATQEHNAVALIPHQQPSQPAESGTMV